MAKKPIHKGRDFANSPHLLPSVGDSNERWMRDSDSERRTSRNGKKSTRFFPVTFLFGWQTTLEKSVKPAVLQRFCSAAAKLWLALERWETIELNETRSFGDSWEHSKQICHLSAMELAETLFHELAVGNWPACACRCLPLTFRNAGVPNGRITPASLLGEAALGNSTIKSTPQKTKKNCAQQDAAKKWTRNEENGMFSWSSSVARTELAGSQWMTPDGFKKAAPKRWRCSTRKKTTEKQQKEFFKLQLELQKKFPRISPCRRTWNQPKHRNKKR